MSGNLRQLDRDMRHNKDGTIKKVLKVFSFMIFEK